MVEEPVLRDASPPMAPAGRDEDEAEDDEDEDDDDDNTGRAPDPAPAPAPAAAVPAQDRISELSLSFLSVLLTAIVARLSGWAVGYGYQHKVAAKSFKHWCAHLTPTVWQCAPMV
jgi:hypothetical protein